MAFDNTEQEQLDTLRNFWKENGKSLIAGVLIGLGALFAYQLWQQNRHAELDQASAAYLEMLDNVVLGKWDEVEKGGGVIVGQYADTVYAQLAALNLATAKFEQGDKVAARAHLRWVIDKADLPELKNMAKLRLAKILIGEGQSEEAIKWLNEITDASFASLVSETLGDAYVRSNEPAKAKEAYQKALDTIGEGGSTRQSILNLKLENI
ncbi:MAG: tetratricopeptide repeat protein [Pseudomonadota bacterium]